MFKRIDIIYKPAKSIEIEPLCYFSDDISKAYSSHHSLGKKQWQECIDVTSVIIAINFSFQKWGKKDTWQIVQEDQGLFIILIISYQDNFYAKGDVPFVIYFYFETTAPTDNCLDPEQKKMFVV